MPYDWKPEYEELVVKFAKQHFGGFDGISRCFPCMRDKYPWGDHRPTVLDSRVPAKNNTEYHGLERHAKQYHATAQYEESYHHWLLAAAWRLDDMKANNFQDEGHDKAVEFTIKHAEYNKALSEWQKQERVILPSPESFGLNSDITEKMYHNAGDEIENYINYQPTKVISESE